MRESGIYILIESLNYWGDSSAQPVVCQLCTSVPLENVGALTPLVAIEMLKIKTPQNWF